MLRNLRSGEINVPLNASSHVQENFRSHEGHLEVLANVLCHFLRLFISIIQTPADASAARNSEIVNHAASPSRPAHPVVTHRRKYEIDLVEGC